MAAACGWANPAPIKSAINAGAVMHRPLWLLRMRPKWSIAAIADRPRPSISKFFGSTWPQERRPCWIVLWSQHFTNLRCDYPLARTSQRTIGYWSKMSFFRQKRDNWSRLGLPPKRGQQKRIPLQSWPGDHAGMRQFLCSRLDADRASDFFVVMGARLVGREHRVPGVRRDLVISSRVAPNVHRVLPVLHTAHLIT